MNGQHLTSVSNHLTRTIAYIVCLEARMLEMEMVAQTWNSTQNERSVFAKIAS